MCEGLWHWNTGMRRNESSDNSPTRWTALERVRQIASWLVGNIMEFAVASADNPSNPLESSEKVVSLLGNSTLSMLSARQGVRAKLMNNKNNFNAFILLSYCSLRSWDLQWRVGKRRYNSHEAATLSLLERSGCPVAELDGRMTAIDVK